MLRFPAVLVSFIALTSIAGCAAPLEGRPAAIVPLRSVRMYETGVGYFERRGAVGGADASALPVPAGHLDDALKTLVVMSQGTRIDAVRWDGSPSPGVARARAGLDGDPNAPIGYRDVLASMKGERVSVTTKDGVLFGRVVDIADEPVPGPTLPKKEGEADPPPKTEPALLLLGDDGNVKRLHPTEFSGVKPLDPAFAERLSRLLGTTSSRAAQAVRLLHLASSAKEPVTFGYVAETPIWRCTYRLVFATDRKGATMQGFALVHNDTEEDWRGVHLSLENGKPDSFLFPLAAPRYTRRELRTPTGEMYTLPQLESTTPDAMWSDFGAGGLGLSGIGEGGGGRGEGIGLGSIGTIGHGSGTGRAGEVSDEVSISNLADATTAVGTEHGAIFSYQIAAPLDLDGHSSALVPFLQQEVVTKPITIFSAAGSDARTAVRFANGTGQTLPEGTIAFYGDGGFIGETTVDRLKPGDVRFLEFGTDLDVTTSSVQKSRKTDATKVTFGDNVIRVHALRTTQIAMTITSKSGVARSVLVALPVVRNTKVDGADGADFDAFANIAYASFEVPGMQELVRPITTTEAIVDGSSVDSMKEKGFRDLAATSGLATADKATLSDAAAKQKEIDDIDARFAAIDKEVAIIDGDVKRLDETLKAAGEGKATGPNPIVTRLLAAEDKRETLRKEREAKALERATKHTALVAILGKLPVES